MTLTERKRINHSLKYLRKDARTAIYRAVYGEQGVINGNRSNIPALDETRERPPFWDYANALAVFKSNIDLAGFSNAETDEMLRRLELLKRIKQTEAAE